MKKIISIIILIILLLPFVSFAHPGRTDSSGCHTCRTNCSSWGLSSGEYHCHRAKSLPQPKEPIKSTYDPDGGYTEPAPEYKAPILNVESIIDDKGSETKIGLIPENKERERETERSPVVIQGSFADMSKNSSNGLIWWWIIGTMAIAYFFYKLGGKKK